MEISKQEWQSVEDTAQKSHNADDHTTAERMSAAGQHAIVTKSFGEGHADTGANGGRYAGHEREVRFVGSECHREDRRQRGNAAVHQSGQPWLYCLQNKSIIVLAHNKILGREKGIEPSSTGPQPVVLTVELLPP